MAFSPQIICIFFIAGTLGDRNDQYFSVRLRVDHDKKLYSILSQQTPHKFAEKLVTKLTDKFREPKFLQQYEIPHPVIFSLRALVPHEETLIYNILKGTGKNLTVESTKDAFRLYGKNWLKHKVDAHLFLVMPDVRAERQRDISRGHVPWRCLQPEFCHSDLRRSDTSYTYR
uniref:Putative secreted protein n=1 Tax=Amblyomma cajennense TaxID=34607 RepID=A0A023FE86_AMBCJ